MKAIAILTIFLALAAGNARADNCGKSRDYLFANLDGDLTLPPKAYEDLFKICTAVIAMSNVRDAYILRDGGIAVVAKQDSVAATAATLESSGSSAATLATGVPANGSSTAAAT